MVRALALVLASFSAIFVNPASALDARQVFQAVAPSTVEIRTFDSGGTGVVLSNTGLILTNYHVVAAGMDLKITASLRVGSKLVTKEISDVKISKVHPIYDLALLEAKAPTGAAFVPARIIPKELPITPGSRCFALGNPGGPNGSALDLSITEGIVSSTSREVEGQNYIQFSAAINPGNSGGPVCDDQGRVFGIATWKMTESEGLGFAIPTAKISLAEFVDPKAKKSNPAVAQQAEELGGRYNALSNLADGREKITLLLAAAECFKVALQASPESPSAYTRLAVVYEKLGEFAIAQRYAEAALKIAPKDSWACHLLGEIKMRGHENDKAIVDQCLQVWFQGLRNDAEAAIRARCAEDIAVTYLGQDQSLAAAYMLRWADVLFAGTTNDPNRTTRSRAWDELQKKLPEQQVEAIRNKEDNFGEAELTALRSGKGANAIVAAKPSTPVITQEQVERLVRNAAQKFSPTQVSVPADGLEVPLPDTPGQAMLAYCGWKVVIAFPELLKLGILNLATGKIDGFIDIDDRRAQFACGGQLLVISSSASKTLDVYDLETVKKITSKPTPCPGPVVYIGMGLLNPTRLFVLHYEEKGSSMPYFAPSFLILPDLARVQLRPEIKNGDNPLVHGFARPTAVGEGSMDTLGRTAVISVAGTIPSGFYQYITSESGKVDFTYAHQDFGAPVLTTNGDFALSKSRIIDIGTSEGHYRTLQSSSRYQCPALIAGYSGLVVYQYGADFHGFRIFGLPALTKLLEIPFSSSDQQSAAGGADDSTEVMLASAYCDRIVRVQPQRKCAILSRLGLKGAETGSGFAVPGKSFTRKLDIPAGSSVEIQSAPPGLRFDPGTSSLMWDVPPDFPKPQTVQVILLTSSPSGKPQYKVEKIAVP